MEWVETTAKTVDEARELALDQLGVAADEAEFDVVDEPRPGLFGRVRGEARVRARVRPAQVRPKQERRRRGRSKSNGAAASTSAAPSNGDGEPSTPPADTASGDDASAPPEPPTAAEAPASSRRRSSSNRSSKQESTMSDDPRPESTVTPDEVGAAAVAFMEGLADAFGADASVAVAVDGLELDVTVTGSELGLLVGPSGRTLNAVQDLARVAAQRRLGDHETRLRVDVGGYRARREIALADFARNVAEQVRTSGTARSLEPMTSADRKVVHDVLNDEADVTSRSVGDDPDRRIIVEPA